MLSKLEESNARVKLRLWMPALRRWWCPGHGGNEATDDRFLYRLSLLMRLQGEAISAPGVIHIANDANVLRVVNEVAYANTKCSFN